MKKHFLAIIFLAITSLTYAQKNFIDQPYVTVIANVDTLVVPDKIFISINLNEANSKNKESAEEQEKQLETTLKQLNIDIEKNLSLLDFSSNFKIYFLKGQNIIKSKSYSLLVEDATTAGKVLAELENVGISNVVIERTEYSKADDLLLELKSKAVEKSKLIAEQLAKPLNQKIGKALHISETPLPNTLQGRVQGIRVRGVSQKIYGSQTAIPTIIEFQKIKFEAQVTVNYILE